MSKYKKKRLPKWNKVGDKFPEGNDETELLVCYMGQGGNLISDITDVGWFRKRTEPYLYWMYAPKTPEVEG